VETPFTATATATATADDPRGHGVRSPSRLRSGRRLHVRPRSHGPTWKRRLRPRPRPRPRPTTRVATACVHPHASARGDGYTSGRVATALRGNAVYGHGHSSPRPCTTHGHGGASNQFTHPRRRSRPHARPHE